MEDSESNNAISSGGFRKHVYKQHVSPAALTQRCSEQQEASKQLRGTLSGSWYRSVVVQSVVEGRRWPRGVMSGEGGVLLSAGLGSPGYHIIQGA